MTAEQRQRLKYIVSDLVASSVALVVFNIIRYFTLPLNYEHMQLQSYMRMPMVVTGQIVFPLMMVGLYGISGYYNDVVSKSRVDEALNTYGIALLGTFMIFFIALYNDSIDDRLHSYEMVLILWVLIGTLSYIPRLMLTRHFNRLIASKKISFKTLVIGTSDYARQIAHELEHKYQGLGFSVVGFVSDGGGMSGASTFQGLPVIGIDQAERAIEEMGIKRLIVVQQSHDPHRMVEIINRFFPAGVSIYITPDSMHYITMRPRTQMVSGEVLIDITRSHVKASTRNLKRISDILFSAVALVLLSPVMLVVAIMVKRSSPGPVIYRQERIGYHKKPFEILKFRTMYTDSEASGPALSSDSDPRITPVGRVLRKYRIDEFPQFWNVLRGEMSIVGPRPEREYYIRQIVKEAPYYSLLQQVRPGITSWGMVKYGYATSVAQMIERARYDLLYIDNVSMIVDLKILLYTIETVITGKGV